MTKVLIEIKDGTVVKVVANEQVDYIIVNRDRQGKDIISDIYSTTGWEVAEEGCFYERFYETNPVEAEIREELKRLKF